MCRAMSRAVLIVLHLMALDFRQDGTRARSFLIHVLEYIALTVQLYWGRKEAPTSASETLWTNTHTRCGYTDLPMSNHLSTDGYLQMVRVRRVCQLANFVCLSVFICLQIADCSWNPPYPRCQSPECYLWLIFMAEPVCLVTEPGPITTGIQVHVHPRKKGPQGRATRTTRQRLLTGFAHFVSCVSSSSGDA